MRTKSSNESMILTRTDEEVVGRHLDYAYYYNYLWLDDREEDEEGDEEEKEGD